MAGSSILFLYFNKSAKTKNGNPNEMSKSMIVNAEENFKSKLLQSIFKLN